MVRFIGIRHRVKRTAEGEARPTMVAIREGTNVRTLELEDDTAELDFVLGRFPTSFRRAEPEEDLSEFAPHHVKKRNKGKPNEETYVPVGYEGLAAGDVVAMSLGGSGDRMAFALSRRGEEIGSSVFRIPPFVFKEQRGDASKEEDHRLLADLVERAPDLFYGVGPRDRQFIEMRETYRARRDIQKDRIRCEQRLRQRFIGRVFLTTDGRYPEGAIEDRFDEAKASDAILSSCLTEEKGRESELKRAVKALDVWREIFDGVEGCGEVLAGGIITPIGDIRRFPTPARLKRYCGVHVLSDGRFPRRRTGTVSNWSPEARQALFLLSQQFTYRPASEWGLYLRRMKAGFRERHPVVECGACRVPWEQCTKRKEVPMRDEGETEVPAEAAKGRHARRYTDGHIHKMAVWRTLTRFVERLHRDWTRLEQTQAK